MSRPDEILSPSTPLQSRAPLGDTSGSSGYGDEPDAVAANVRGVIEAGAGADSLLVPGLLDLDVLSTLSSTVSLPVNVMVGPGASGLASPRAVGVRPRHHHGDLRLHYRRR
jgi:2-methylisocitrate lyase-like PEP mutase family enzyme